MHRKRVLIGLLCVIFMTAVEATVVATAMPSVIADLGGVALYGWVSAGYLLASTVSVPIYGKLADLRGRKPALFFGIVLFLAGSVASGAAHSTLFLIAARVVQGLGAGALQPVAITIVGDLYTLEERGRVQGWLGSVWALAGAAGPLLGGFFVDALSWRWVFWFNVPFGLIASAVLMREYREDRSVMTGALNIDWIGAASLGTAAVAVLTFAERRAVPLSLAILCIAIVVFVVNERHARDPIIPRDLLANPFVVSTLALSALVGCLMLGFLTYAPLYVQGVLSRTPAQAGSVVTPMLISWPLTSAIVGRNLSRLGSRLPVLFGSVMSCIGALSVALLVPRTDAIWPWWLGSCLLGIGMGATVTATTVVLQLSVPWNRRGVATALMLFTRSIGSALAVGGLGALLTARLATMLDPERVGPLLAHDRTRDIALDATAAHALAVSFVPLLWVLAAIPLVNFVLSISHRPPIVVAAAAPAKPA